MKRPLTTENGMTNTSESPHHITNIATNDSNNEIWLPDNNRGSSATPELPSSLLVDHATDTNTNNPNQHDITTTRNRNYINGNNNNTKRQQNGRLKPGAGADSGAARVLSQESKKAAKRKSHASTTKKKTTKTKTLTFQHTSARKSSPNTAHSNTSETSMESQKNGTTSSSPAPESDEDPYEKLLSFDPHHYLSLIKSGTSSSSTLHSLAFETLISHIHSLQESLNNLIHAHNHVKQESKLIHMHLKEKNLHLMRLMKQKKHDRAKYRSLRIKEREFCRNFFYYHMKQKAEENSWNLEQFFVECKEEWNRREQLAQRSGNEAGGFWSDVQEKDDSANHASDSTTATEKNHSSSPGRSSSTPSASSEWDDMDKETLDMIREGQILEHGHIRKYLESMNKEWYLEKPSEDSANESPMDKKINHTIEQVKETMSNSLQDLSQVEESILSQYAIDSLIGEETAAAIIKREKEEQRRKERQAAAQKRKPKMVSMDGIQTDTTTDSVDSSQQSTIVMKEQTEKTDPTPVTQRGDSTEQHSPQKAENLPNRSSKGGVIRYIDSNHEQNVAQHSEEESGSHTSNQSSRRSSVSSSPIADSVSDSDRSEDTEPKVRLTPLQINQTSNSKFQHTLKRQDSLQKTVQRNALQNKHDPHSYPNSPQSTPQTPISPASSAESPSSFFITESRDIEEEDFSIPSTSDAIQEKESSSARSSTTGSPVPDKQRTSTKRKPSKKLKSTPTKKRSRRGSTNTAKEIQRVRKRKALEMKMRRKSLQSKEEEDSYLTDQEAPIRTSSPLLERQSSLGPVRDFEAKLKAETKPTSPDEQTQPTQSDEDDGAESALTKAELDALRQSLSPTDRFFPSNHIKAKLKTSTRRFSLSPDVVDPPTPEPQEEGRLSVSSALSHHEKMPNSPKSHSSLETDQKDVPSPPSEKQHSSSDASTQHDTAPQNTDTATMTTAETTEASTQSKSHPQNKNKSTHASTQQNHATPTAKVVTIIQHKTESNKRYLSEINTLRESLSAKNNEIAHLKRILKDIKNRRNEEMDHEMRRALHEERRHQEEERRRRRTPEEYPTVRIPFTAVDNLDSLNIEIVDHKEAQEKLKKQTDLPPLRLSPDSLLHNSLIPSTTMNRQFLRSAGSSRSARRTEKSTDLMENFPPSQEQNGHAPRRRFSAASSRPRKVSSPRLRRHSNVSQIGSSGLSMGDTALYSPRPSPPSGPANTTHHEYGRTVQSSRPSTSSAKRGAAVPLSARPRRSSSSRSGSRIRELKKPKTARVRKRSSSNPARVG